MDVGELSSIVAASAACRLSEPVLDELTRTSSEIVRSICSLACPAHMLVGGVDALYGTTVYALVDMSDFSRDEPSRDLERELMRRVRLHTNIRRVAAHEQRHTPVVAETLVHGHAIHVAFLPVMRCEAAANDGFEDLGQQQHLKELVVLLQGDDGRFRTAWAPIDLETYVIGSNLQTNGMFCTVLRMAMTWNHRRATPFTVFHLQWACTFCMPEAVWSEHPLAVLHELFQTLLTHCLVMRRASSMESTFSTVGVARYAVMHRRMVRCAESSSCLSAPEQDPVAVELLSYLNQPASEGSAFVSRRCAAELQAELAVMTTREWVYGAAPSEGELLNFLGLSGGKAQQDERAVPGGPSPLVTGNVLSDACQHVARCQLGMLRSDVALCGRFMTWLFDRILVRTARYPEGAFVGVHLHGSTARGTSLRSSSDVDVLVDVNPNAVSREAFGHLTTVFDLVLHVLTIGAERVEAVREEGQPLLYRITFDPSVTSSWTPVVVGENEGECNACHFLVRWQRHSVGLCFGSEWTSESLTFDIVPTYIVDNGLSLIGSFKRGPIATNIYRARAHLRAVVRESVLKASAVHLVRLAKHWNSLCARPVDGSEKKAKPFKSYVLELASCAFVRERYSACDTSNGDLFAIVVVRFFAWLKQNISFGTQVPGVRDTLVPFCGNNATWPRNDVVELLQRTVDALEDGLTRDIVGSSRASIQQWSRVFGDEMLAAFGRLGGDLNGIEALPHVSTYDGHFAPTRDVATPQVHILRSQDRGEWSDRGGAVSGEPDHLEQLRDAARSGNTEDLVRLADDIGVSGLNEPDERGRTALHIAANLGHVDCVRALLKRNVSVTERDQDGFCAFAMAAKENRDEVIRILVEHCAPQVEQSDALKNSFAGALAFACSNGFDQIATLLLQHIHPDHVPPPPLYSGKPLLCTVVVLDRNNPVKLVRQLLSKGANPNIVGEYESPLSHACIMGWPSVIESLLEYGAEDSDALHDAASRGHVEVVRVLLDPKWSIEVGDTWKAMEAAAEGGFVEVIELLLCRSVLLREETAVVACMNGHLTLMKLLLRHRPELLNAASDDGSFPLFVACANNHVHVARYLLESGADPNQIHRALHLTPIQGTVAVDTPGGSASRTLRLLLEHSGTCVSFACPEQPLTALQLAITRHHRASVLTILRLRPECFQEQLTTTDGTVLRTLQLISVFSSPALLHEAFFTAAQMHVHSCQLCDHCGVGSFRGVRYHCAPCGYDLCEGCFRDGRYEHDRSHSLVPWHNCGHPFHE